jgi:hypothetical protein
LNFGDDIRTQTHDILDMLFPSFQTEEREGDGPSVEAQLRARNSAKIHGGGREGRRTSATSMKRSSQPMMAFRARKTNLRTMVMLDTTVHTHIRAMRDGPRLGTEPEDGAAVAIVAVVSRSCLLAKE